jgi:hypothetical protein
VAKVVVVVELECMEISPQVALFPRSLSSIVITVSTLTRDRYQGTTADQNVPE